MLHWHRLDAFQLVSGLLAVLAGPVMLFFGASPGWAALITVTGAIELTSLWLVLTAEIEDRSPGPPATRRPIAPTSPGRPRSHRPPARRAHTRRDRSTHPSLQSSSRHS